MTVTSPDAAVGSLVGYALLHTRGQEQDRAEQTAELAGAGCERIFTGDAGHDMLTACLDSMRPGDTLVVPRLDRLSRSLRDLVTTVAGLRRRDIGFVSLHEGLDTTTADGRLVFHVFTALAEFIREVIAAGTRDGQAAAAARGKHPGRPPAMTPERVRHARELLARPENTVSSIARLLGVSRTTIYKYVPEVAAGAITRPAAARYQSRPGRGAVVARRLSGLRGPAAGVVRLPLRLFWSLPGHEFDLADRDMRLWLYQTVLREAATEQDLATYLNGDLLAELWPDLYLPRGVRRAWQDRHPVLADAASAAALCR